MLALIADVHGNLEALDAVLADIDRRAPGARIVCAGDVVGYGPDPEACLDRLLERDALIVRGNHEEMVLGWRDTTQCVHAGIVASAWTRDRLSLRALTVIAGLPAVVDAGHGIVVCHGDLDDAGTYVSDAPRAASALERLRVSHPSARILVCGHTHRAMCFSSSRGLQFPGVELGLHGVGRTLLNPGSVGQARERAALASWACYDVDGDVVSFTSLPYDHEITIAKLRRAGLVARVVLPPPEGMERRLAPHRAKAARFWIEARPRIEEALRKDAARADAGDVDDTSGAGAPAVDGPNVKRRVLAIAQRMLHSSGASAAFTRVRALSGRRGGAMILSYHSVTSSADVPFIDPRFGLPLAVFQQQMEFLAAERRVLAMSDLVDRVRRRAPIPAGSVVITFDDGYLNTLRTAAPVLDRLGLPALVYLPTGQIERAQSQFIDVLHGAFALRTRNTLSVPAAGLAPVELRGRRAVQRIYIALGDRLSTMSLHERAEVLAMVVDQLRPSRPAPRLTMNWDEVVELGRKHRFDVGVHTRDHLDLTSLDVEETRAELGSCIADLQAVTGKLPEHFAYPYGRCSTRVRDDVAATSLRSAAVTEPAGLVTHDADVFTLPRLLAPASMELFPFFTSGAYPEFSKAVLRRA
ncbi:MAG: metallophosphoesterase family protein [Deltaproteobacteria bacterium]|nr:metallophosphoesterase family protein [Deltaproteobacteria bacterium]